MQQFKLWDSPQMHTEFGRADNKARLKEVVFDGDLGQTIDWVVYWGTPNTQVKMQTTQNSGIDNITITPVSALPVRQNNTPYQVGQLVEPDNGFFYVCLTAGNSASSPPNWLAQAGARIADGDVVWSCVGRRMLPSDVRLSLSKDGLNQALGGAPLSLGHTLLGGSALPIYIRFTCQIPELFDFPDTAQVSLLLNDCVESAK